MDVIVRKVARKIGVLRLHSKNLSSSAKTAFVRSIINPDIDYCSPARSNNTSGLNNRLQRLEKSSIRAMAGLRRYDRTGLGDLNHCFLFYPTQTAAWSSNVCLV